MEKLPLKTIAFLQAAGVTAYVLTFAFTVQTLIHRFGEMEPNPFLAMTLFLLAFVFSATVCSTIFLGYPAYLFFEGKKQESVRLVLASVLWLAAFLIAFLMLLPFTFTS